MYRPLKGLLPDPPVFGSGSIITLVKFNKEM